MERLKVETMPLKLSIDSDPYVRFVGRTFVPVIDVTNVKTRRSYFLIISPVSIAQQIKKWADEEGGILHLEFWIHKSSDDKFAKYEVTQA